MKIYRKSSNKNKFILNKTIIFISITITVISLLFIATRAYNFETKTHITKFEPEHKKF